MDSCAVFGVVAQVLSKTIEEIKQGEFKDYNNLKVICILLERKLEFGEIDQPCLDCDDCMTFVENRRTVYGYLFLGKDQQWVKEQEQHVRKARGQDQILRHLYSSIQVNPEDHNRKPYIPTNKQLVYLDHNVIDKYHKEEEKRIRLTPGYVDIEYVFSPSHLEEIKRMNNEEEEQKVISTIREITCSLFISHFEGNELSLAYEDPEYGIRRVLKSEVAPDVEAYRVITTDDRKIYHPERTDEVYLSKLTFDHVFNHPTVIAVCKKFQWEELIDDKGRIKHFSFVHQAIHALVRALDNLGYKTDKNRAIKSSAHDIEHMIYAAGTDLLVTMDKKFKERSMLIYQRLGIRTNVMDWDQYKDYVDSLVHSNPKHY
ncbi:hypothetical protein AB4Z50_14645 [Paenibacillus sp. 2TAB26]|uniref:hypothetical protein n=1 Tax=Paenibacillus sp. 2TAB26 TaxID=3233005 RepID=UPI003F954B0E